VQLSRAGILGPAEDELVLATGMDNAFSDLARIELAAAYAREPDPARSAKARDAARGVPYRSLHGGLPARTDAEYNAILESVASARGIPVADPAASFNRDGTDYMDFAHLNPRGHEKVARLLARIIRERGLLSAAQGQGGGARRPTAPRSMRRRS